MPAIRHHHVEIDDLKVFVREAGDVARPTLVLLPGYPSGTRSYIRLIDRLSPNRHTVAIDYLGFGSSDPLPESPTFDGLAEITGKAINKLGIGDYAICMVDFGSPAGFRIALEHDQRVRRIVTQNDNAYVYVSLDDKQLQPQQGQTVIAHGVDRDLTVEELERKVKL